MSTREPELHPRDMTDHQRACWQLICDLMGGDWHVTGKVRAAGRHGLSWNARHLSLATFDYDRLTHLVVLAHDRCIRAEIGPSGPGMLNLTLHQRPGRTGEMTRRHPTLEDAIIQLRARPSFPNT